MSAPISTRQSSTFRDRESNALPPTAQYPNFLQVAADTTTIIVARTNLPSNGVVTVLGAGGGAGTTLTLGPVFLKGDVVKVVNLSAGSTVQVQSSAGNALGSVIGTAATLVLGLGKSYMANQDNPTLVAHWYVYTGA